MTSLGNWDSVEGQGMRHASSTVYLRLARSRLGASFYRRHRRGTKGLHVSSMTLCYHLLMYHVGCVRLKVLL